MVAIIERMRFDQQGALTETSTESISEVELLAAQERAKRWTFDYSAHGDDDPEFRAWEALSDEVFDHWEHTQNEE